MRGNLEITEETKNKDGTSTLTFELDNEFIEWFKELQSLKRWSNKRFETFIIETITYYLNKTQKEKEKEEVYQTIVQENKEGELFIELPQKLLDQLGWKIGDDMSWEEVEICEEWGEHKGFTLSNTTKNPKVRKT